MNVLFLTLLDFESLQERNIYTDLLREFVKNGHHVYCISPVERRKKQNIHLVQEDGCDILRLKIGNIQKTNVVEKGISTLLIESQFIEGIKKYFSTVKFDLVLYSTPPITFCRAIEYVKNRDNARTYLMLKDIFPQNAVDLGMMSTTGLKGILYRYFRNKEKRLYEISDRIGCMSKANVKYILEHNPDISPLKVEVCPNCIDTSSIISLSDLEKKELREKYKIPLDRKVFVYGGNLGKPQGIHFIIECLKSQLNNEKSFFLIVGDGTEYSHLDNFIKEYRPKNIRLMKRLPKEDYDRMIAACDIGLIFLDHRFTIPNFPSRLLGYMQAGLPVLACTDLNTDIGKTIVEGQFGWWCESNSMNDFFALIQKINYADIEALNQNSRNYLCQNFSVDGVYAECFFSLLERIKNEDY